MQDIFLFFPYSRDKRNPLIQTTGHDKINSGTARVKSSFSSFVLPVPAVHTLSLPGVRSLSFSLLLSMCYNSSHAVPLESHGNFQEGTGEAEFPFTGLTLIREKR